MQHRLCLPKAVYLKLPYNGIQLPHLSLMTSIVHAIDGQNTTMQQLLHTHLAWSTSTSIQTHLCFSRACSVAL